MKKSIILLTKSRKHNNYCVAGIELDTGNWVRLVSDNSLYHCAVPKEDLMYEDQSEAEILDNIEVEITKHVPLDYQPENFEYDSGYYWSKIGKSTMTEVENILAQSKDPFIFYNSDKKIPVSEVQGISQDKMYSLKLIKVTRATLYATIWDGKENISYTMSFTYNGVRYNYLSITDDDFTRQYPEEGKYFLTNLSLVISLAEPYEKDQSHYKLVAAIIT